MTSMQEEALRRLLLAIEHIQLPLSLDQTQVNVYNELMFAAANVEIRFELDEQD